MNFKDYIFESRKRDLVNVICELNLDSEEILNEYISLISELDNQENFNEFAAGLQRAYGGISNVAKSMAPNMSDMKDKFGQFANTVKTNVQNGMNNIKNTYQQGSNISTLSQAEKSVSTLIQDLNRLGYNSPGVKKNLDFLINHLRTASQKVQNDPNQNVGPGSGAFGSYNT